MVAQHVQLLLQEKIYDILRGDTELQNLKAKVFDNVPEDTCPPYIEIGEDEYDDFSSHDFDGFDGSVWIHVWSESAGRKELKQIQNRVYELLHDQDMAIENFPTLTFLQEFCKNFKENDGRTHHGVQRFDFLMGGIDK
jgi:hypothetical protein